jgi:tetratricopeptide (TPR) repeat protein
LINLTLESTVVMLDLVFEHRLYLPSIGLTLLVAVGAEAVISRPHWGRRMSRQRAVLGAVAAVVLLFGWWTWERNQVWNDRVGIWEDAARKYPENPRAWFNLGALYMIDGRVAQATQSFETAVSLWPAYRPKLPREVQRISRILLKKKLRQEALEMFTWADLIVPDNGVVHFAAGSFLLETQGPASAVARLQKAVDLSPDDAVMHDKLGMVYFQTGDFERGQSELLRAIELNPTLIETYARVADEYRRRGAFDVAGGLYQAILAARPGRQDVLEKLREMERRAGPRPIAQ